MGTRGVFGLRIGGRDKLAYNHYDSYPEALGQEIISDVRDMIREIGREGMKLMATNLKVVDEDTKPTEEEIEALKQYHDGGVSTGEKTEWYSLLRDLQGKLKETLKAGFMIDAGDFIKNSLFCEWGYIVNLDTGKLEVYKGFQRAEHSLGRYVEPKPADWEPQYKGQDYYFPCALIAEFDIENLPDDLTAALPKDEDEE